MEKTFTIEEIVETLKTKPWAMRRIIERGHLEVDENGEVSLSDLGDYLIRRKEGQDHIQEIIDTEEEVREVL